MNPTILQTKFFRPPVRSDRIERPRLLALLDDGLSKPGHRLTLLVAPAGYGKTSLASEWFSGGARVHAWFTNDEADNDPIRWFAHLIGALQTIKPTFGLEQMAMLRASPAPPSTLLMQSLINDVVECFEPFSLVFDDYHTIHETLIHDAVRMLLDHMPPAMQLVIISRGEPPLPLARLRARNQMTQVGGSDLRFTLEETARFVNEQMGFALSAKMVLALEERTEGWIAGLQLAALSLRNASDVESFVASFQGNHRYVLDFLMEEVLLRQPETVQTFLLHTSVLEGFCAGLCDRVLQRSDSQAQLEALEAASLFVIPLDNQRTWYRYHQLFGELLRFRLRCAHPGLATVLHGRASRWFADNGFLPESIDHALKAEEWERASTLIHSALPTVNPQWVGNVFLLLRWMEQLPDPILESDRALDIFYTWLLADTSQFGAAEARLNRISVDDERAARAAVIRSQIALTRGRTTKAIRLAEEGLRDLGKEEQFWRESAVLSLLFGAYQGGDMTEAADVANELPPLAENPTSMQVLVHSLAGIVQLTYGNYSAAEQRFRTILQRAVLADYDGRTHPMAGLAQIGLGEVLLAWNRPSEAAPLVEAGLRSAAQTGNVITLVRGYRTRLLLHRARENADGVEETLRQMQALENELASARLWMAEALAAYRRWFKATAGRIDELAAWMGVYQAQCSDRGASDVDLFHVRQLQELAFARALIELGRGNGDPNSLERAVAVLERVIAAAAAKGIHEIHLSGWLYLSLAQQTLNQEDRALAALHRAIELAAPAGIIRAFIDEGAGVAPLLSQLVLDAELSAFGLTLDSALADAVPASARKQRSGAEGGRSAQREMQEANERLLEPLTQRELEVLQLLAAGKTNKEIAAQLHITVGTVKSHAKGIYGKLAVNNRTEAAVKARAAGLI